MKKLCKFKTKRYQPVRSADGNQETISVMMKIPEHEHLVEIKCLHDACTLPHVSRPIVYQLHEI